MIIDYGLHVFVRCREEREPEEEIRPPTGRALTGVAAALVVFATLVPAVKMEVDSLLERFGVGCTTFGTRSHPG